MTATTWEFDLAGHSFKAERLNAMDQFHLSRKITPLIPPLVPLVLKTADSKLTLALVNDLKETITRVALNEDLNEMAKLAEPFTLVLANMKNEVAEEILSIALSSVKVRTGDGVWMPLWGPSKLAPVIELNDIGKLLPIAVKVIWLNLKPFINGFLTSHEEPAPVQSGVPFPARKIG